MSTYQDAVNSAYIDSPRMPLILLILTPLRITLILTTWPELMPLVRPLMLPVWTNHRMPLILPKSSRILCP